MFLFENDCTIYKVNNKIPFENIGDSTLNNRRYEKFVTSVIRKDIVKITYSWLDPVKVRDKIVSNDTRSVTFIYFPNKDILGCFGSSESCIGHALNKIQMEFKVVLDKVNTFEIIENKIFENKNWFGKVVGLHIYDKSFSNEKKISIKDLSLQDLKNYYQNYIVTCFTCYSDFDKTYFYLDKESVLTFPDNIKEDVVYNVLEKFVEHT